MGNALTAEERLKRLDEEVEDLKHRFIEALEHLRDSPEVDSCFLDRWRTMADRIKHLRSAIEPDDYDKQQIVTLGSALLDTRDLLDLTGGAGDLDVYDGLLIALERIRHVVREALDEHVNGVSDNVGMVMADIEQWLPSISDEALADVIGVNRRTLSRWRAQDGPPQRQLRLFARLVAILRHNWDEYGVMSWFSRPRRDLDGRKPVALLREPGAEDRLIDAARAGRSQYAT